MIRDILRYNDEEIKSLSLEQYAFALAYCVESYKRRDIVGVLAEMGKGVKKLKKGKKNELNLNFEHSGIMEYIEQNTVVPEFIKLKTEDK